MHDKCGQMDVNKMKLYTFDVAPNPRRLKLFLAYKGIELETIAVDLGKKEQLAEGYLAINPAGTVPTLLLDDGSVLTDVIACCFYLESQYPDKPLFGRTDMERARVLGWVHKIFVQGLMAVAEMVRNQGDFFKNRALPGPRDLEQIPALVERGKLRLGDFYALLESQLQGGDYLLGDSLSMADIDAMVVVDFAAWVKESIPADHALTQAWYERVKVELGCL